MVLFVGFRRLKAARFCAYTHDLSAA